MAKKKSSKKTAKRRPAKRSRARAISAVGAPKASITQVQVLARAAELTEIDGEVFMKHVEQADKEAKDLLKKAKRVDFDPSKLTRDEAGALEAIILSSGRPVFFVDDDDVERPSDALWRRRLGESAASVRGNLPSVGRVEINIDPSIMVLGDRTDRLLGTCFAVAPDVVLTNRHVAEVFCEADGSLKRGFDARVDFAEERRRDPDSEFRVLRALEIGSDLDYAILEVENAPGFPEPLTLVESASEVDIAADPLVYIVGYPAFDSRNPTALQNEIFGGIFDVKRLAPGRLRELDAGRRFQGDYTSLGGNSGSAVFDLASGKVVGLHYAGSYGGANFSVPAWLLTERIRAAVAGSPVERSASARSPVAPLLQSGSKVEVIGLLHRILDQLDKLGATHSIGGSAERARIESSVAGIIRNVSGVSVTPQTPLREVFRTRASLSLFLNNHINLRFRPRPLIHVDELWPNGTVGDLENLIQSRS